MATTYTTAVGTDTAPTILNRPRIAGIVLAAGRASRFGSDKRLAQYNRRHTLLSRSIEVVEQYCDHVFVITRPGDEDRELLGRFANTQHIEQYVAPDSLRGMGASLASGIARLVAFEQQCDRAFDGALVMLADMPYIREQTIEHLIASFAQDKIVIPSYLQQYKEKKWGNPVMFSRKWFSALQGLSGDRGAKSLIKAHPCARVEVVVDDAGILRDVDTPEDLQK